MISLWNTLNNKVQEITSLVACFLMVIALGAYTYFLGVKRPPHINLIIRLIFLVCVN